MRLHKDVALDSRTTLHVGGRADFFVDAMSEDDVREAVSFAQSHSLPLYVLGAGSNTLVPDGPLHGLVLRLRMNDVSIAEADDTVLVTVDAGLPWENLVDVAAMHNWYGIENLAGIPGTVGGAVVQNIGAYGTDIAATFSWAECIDLENGERVRIVHDHASFGYRSSVFKTRKELLVVRVQFMLKKQGVFNLEYTDVQAAAHEKPPRTVMDLVQLVRSIRAKKFPYGDTIGTAGSFFKNPIVSFEQAQILRASFPDVPTHQIDATTTKVPLAWILDHALHLKGFRKGAVALFERQPLVLVTYRGAKAHDVHTFAEEVTKKVFDATNIHIEREVETFAPKIIYEK